MNTRTEPNLQALVATLRRYHSAYKRLNNKRDKVAMSDQLRVWPKTQRQADTLCGKIMRTERRIIEAIMSSAEWKQAGPTATVVDESNPGFQV